VSRVLIVEDEDHLAQGLRYNLEAEGHTVEVAGDGESALERLLENHEAFDALVLDVMLPGKSGFNVASELRRNKNYVPILMLTARGRAEDVLQGFASGADDYLPKPFELPILIARLDGLLRRSSWMKEAVKSKDGGKDDVTSPDGGRDLQGRPDVFSFNGKTIDFGELELRTFGNTIHLTVMESEFLRHLIRNNGKVVSRKSILEEVWDLHEDTDTRAIDNFVVRLRRYIEEDPSQPRHLQTVRGVGYRFVADPESGVVGK
jgi:DNA-binding response OmpR family regulator